MLFKEIQNKISLLYSDSSATTADYLACLQALSSFSHKEIPHYVRRGKIAVLSSFTIQGLSEVMKVRGIFHNIWLEIFISGYNQFSQEILNPDSNLYSFKPDIIYLIVEAKDFLDKEHLNQLVENLTSRLKVKIVIFNFVSSEDFNGNLKIIEEKYAQVRVFDFVSFLGSLGKEKYWYTKYKDLGDLRLSPNAFVPLSEKLLGYAVDFLGATKKCLVTDLDNTLWKGIVGEDGALEIIPDKNFQNYLLELSKSGAILAINSKNNVSDAFEAIDNHPDMILRKKNFSAWRINWQDKVKNLEELAFELNIGLDSFVFIDDSPFEMNLVRDYLPEVAVMPPELIKNYSGFQKSSLTKEDSRRSEMYQEEKKREEFKASFGNIDDYLKNLEIKIKVGEANSENIPRVSQLTQKTNQFNVTTRRYSEDDIRDFLKKGSKVWTLEVWDRFGEYGLTGICIVIPDKTSPKARKIDTFLLSCRVLGRGAEKAFLGFILEKVKGEGAEKILGEYIPTKKNVLCESFFLDNKFELIKKEGVNVFYEYNLNNHYQMPKFIKFI